MSVQIPIKSSPGTYFLISKEDENNLGKMGWYLRRDGYLTAHLPGSGAGENKKTVRLGRAVYWSKDGVWPPDNMEVDHKNRDKKDNRRENLRLVPKYLNQRNQARREGSLYHGVMYDKRNGVYVGNLAIWNPEKKKREGRIYASSTHDIRIAAMCYDCIINYFEGYTDFNFPELTFEEKWQEIGEKQRRQITHSLTKNGITPKVV